MRQLKMIFVAALALCALSAPIVANASAALVTLPEKARTYTGKSIGTAALLTVGKDSITCKSAKGEGTEEAKAPKGEFHVAFEECKESIFGTACTGTGDTAGNVLVLGTWDGVFDALGTGAGLGTAIHTAFNEFQITCDGGIVAIKFKGDLICLGLNPTVKSKEHESHCNESTAGSGKPEETKYWLEGVERTASLQVSFNGGAFEEAALVGLAKSVTTEEIFADQ